MKKITIVLALVFCLLLCSCGGISNVKSDLVGEWTQSVGDVMALVFTFSDNDSFLAETMYCGESILSKSGTYEITKDKIVLNYAVNETEEGTTPELTYTYTNKTLTLSADDSLGVMMKTDDVKNKLQGVWRSDESSAVYVDYEFFGDKVKGTLYIKENGSINSYNTPLCPYLIMDDAIYYYDSTDGMKTYTMLYSFEDGNEKIWDKEEGITMMKVKD